MIKAEISVTTTGKFDLGALRRLVEEANSLHLPDAAYVEASNLGITVVYSTRNVSEISCGEHMPGDEQYDLIVQMHGGCDE